MNQIEGKVASVLTDRQLVINRGQVDGIEIGMKFAIMASRESDIFDPDSGETIGSVEVVKTVVKIVQVDEKMSIGKTFRTLKEDGGFLSLNSEWSRAFAPSTTRVETLDQTGRISERELDPAKSYVKVGDIALQIMTAEPLSSNLEVLAGVNIGARRVNLTIKQITEMAASLKKPGRPVGGYRIVDVDPDGEIVEVSVNPSGSTGFAVKARNSGSGYRQTKKAKS